MKLIITEKPSVGQSIGRVLGASKRCDGYLEGNGYLVSWCVGHLVELAEPQVYDNRYEKWSRSDLPILPERWQYRVTAATCIFETACSLRPSCTTAGWRSRTAIPRSMRATA